MNVLFEESQGPGQIGGEATSALPKVTALCPPGGVSAGPQMTLLLSAVYWKGKVSLQAS